MWPRAGGRPGPAGALSLLAANDDVSADPLRIMAGGLAGPSDHAPETILIAWLLSLPNALDPAIAAERLLVRFADQKHGPDAQRLLALLDETTRWPRTGG